MAAHVCSHVRVKQRGGNQESHRNQDAVIEKKLTDFKQKIFWEGTNVTLWCADNVTNAKWSEFIYIVWNISREGRKCYLGLSPKSDDTCNDGKRLVNTTNGVYLFIPKISMEDEGFYSCDLSYKGESNAANVSVRVTRLETQLDSENGQRFAVCKATYKEKPPTLHWEPAVNFSNSSIEKDGRFFIMETRVRLDDDDVSLSNLSCVASYGSVLQKSTLDLNSTQENAAINAQWDIWPIAISAGSVCFMLVSLTVVYLLRRKLTSAMKMLCCKSKTSPPAEDKPPQPTDVEEVEPYASYIQRVNSIYNSSAELFNA
ncbi:cell surface glycoprotein CD200 receptor 1 isoform X2 [Pseudorasbora parva]|uniref:cell surface glycoprotein CD200 receptor 1 isoform X2 n=1 Tax=Pseudorasbora parva TaxID=51549 RepID=UPI00351DCFDC